MGMTVAEIREMLRSADSQEFEALERSLAADTRKGVRDAIEVCRRRIAAEKAELERLERLYAFDADYGEGLLVGLDEVGRGAVAGPLAVGAVVLRSDPLIEGLNDSKQLSPEQREEIAAVIKQSALAWSVAYVGPKDIDRRGMSACLKEAFSSALEEVDVKVGEIETVLVDGNPLGIDSREKNVVKGDSKSAAIAGASIVAKVERDRFMREASTAYPRYGFEKNKGYGSAEHIDAIKRWGLSDMHRETFCRSFTQPTLF